MAGARADDTRVKFVGVNLFGVRNGQFRWGRIYTELVREAGDVSTQIDRMTHVSRGPAAKEGKERA